MIDIQIKKEPGCAIVHVSGRIDATTCDDLEDSLMQLLDDGEKNIILGLSKTEYISSAGLRVLIVITKQLYDTGSFCLCDVSENVLEIIEMAGFHTIMNIYDTIEAARNGIIET